MSPKAIVISLDGATPFLVDRYLASGVLDPNEGIGLLKNQGISAQQNITVTPSLTAPAHIGIATGANAARNDITANSFHLVASPFAQNTSGFAAPIGGYDIHGSTGPAVSEDPTAEPLWVNLQDSGKKVVAATFPGADGADIRLDPSDPNSPLLQSSEVRTVDYTVPFGSFASVGAEGFNLTAADFSAAPRATTNQLNTAGRISFSPVLQTKQPLDTFTVDNITYNIQVAALDTTNDNKKNYDTLAFFDQSQGIAPGPFDLPATGPAYAKASENRSSLFFLEGSENKAGTSFYVSNLAPDLSTVRIARYSANFIPRNEAVLEDVEDINNNVGFWAPQPDFRIPERISPGFTDFPDQEVEAIYQDQVRSFVDYQTEVALRSINQNPDADLVMTYIEQPDGSGHQFLLTDPRQATDPTDPSTIGAGQDQDKVARYAEYLETAYQAADAAVQRIIETVGTDSNGTPNSNIFVVSDHGFAPFHTAVSINNLLADAGFDSNEVRAVTSGPAVNVYINLEGREPDGTVSRSEYVALQQKIIDTLARLVDTNPNYAPDGGIPVFDGIDRRPVPGNLNDPAFGTGTTPFIGQDGGDVFAILEPGYNFDGTQDPVVQRQGDTTGANPVFSVPNFYGAHGYDPNLPEMSAILYAAGPDIGQGNLGQVRNIDIAPTIEQILGVEPDSTVQGRPIDIVPTDSTSGPDFLSGSDRPNLLDGQAGDDTLTGRKGDDTLTGGGGQDRFMIRLGDGTDTITDFGGTSTGTEPLPSTVAEVDILQFEGEGLTAENLLLAQQGSNLVLTFAGIQDTEVVLKNFDLENLDNLQLATGASAGIGNILFNEQSEIEDSFDVFDAEQQRQQVFQRDSVTFPNSLDNDVQGFDGSKDVINAQEGNDTLAGLGGNDILRGGAGEDTLSGGAGEDQFWIASSGLSEGTDTITDFKVGTDVIGIAGLPGVTSIGDLDITQTGADTLITALDQNLAILKGIEASTINSSFAFA